MLRTAAGRTRRTSWRSGRVAFLWIACSWQPAGSGDAPPGGGAAFLPGLPGRALAGQGHAAPLVHGRAQIFRWLAAVLLLLAGLTLAALSFSFSLNWLAGLLPFTPVPNWPPPGLYGPAHSWRPRLLAAVLVGPAWLCAGMAHTPVAGARLAVVLTLGAALLLGPGWTPCPRPNSNLTPWTGRRPWPCLVPAAPGATTPGTAAPETSAPSAPAAPASTPTPAPKQPRPKCRLSPRRGALPASRPEATAPPRIKSPETPMPQIRDPGGIRLLRPAVASENQISIRPGATGHKSVGRRPPASLYRAGRPEYCRDDAKERCPAPAGLGGAEHCRSEAPRPANMQLQDAIFMRRIPNYRLT